MHVVQFVSGLQKELNKIGCGGLTFDKTLVGYIHNEVQDWW